MKKKLNKTTAEITTGNLVKLRNAIDNFKVGDIGVVIKITEPTINFPQGIAIVKMKRGIA